MNNLTYIHPEHSMIHQFIIELRLADQPLKEIISRIFQWFDSNITYSRISAPYFPLQRCDLDVLKFKSGTCGDYSNLLVSVLIRLGYQAKYAYLKTDCYGEPQDHICAAVWDEERWKLIDATLPYRKWMGFDCPHREYDLFLPEELEGKLKEEEAFWTKKAINWGNEKYAGLLYAPWIHEEIVKDDREQLETIFYLLSFHEDKKLTIYVNYMVYKRNSSRTPIMCRIEEGKKYYSFSVHPASNLWDNMQWSDEYASDKIPPELIANQFKSMRESMDKVLPEINHIVSCI